MTVNQEMRPSLGAAPGLRRFPGFRYYDRMTRGRTQSRFEADFLAMLHHPLCTRMKVSLMLRLGRDTRKTDILAQFFNESGLVLFQIFQHLLHEEALYQPRRKDAKANGPDAR